MKLLVVCLAMTLGASAHAVQRTITCSDPSSSVSVSGTYDVQGTGSDADYTMLENLVITGQDDSSSSDAYTGTRQFLPSQVDLSSEGGWFVLTAHSPSGSRVQVRHRDHVAGTDRVVISMQATSTHDAFAYRYVTSCTFN